MRPVKHVQGTLSHPLNQILGTEASVRVLREILLLDIPIGIADLARRTMLQASGLPAVCARLEDLGTIETVGRGRSRQFRRAQRSPLVGALVNMFTAERARALTVMSDIRQRVQSMSLRAAWVEGPVARDEDRPEDPIVIVALTSADTVESMRTQLWGQLLPVQEAYDVAIELRVETEADLVAADDLRLADLETAIPLAGAPPIELARPRASEPMASRAKRHEDVDARLLRTGAAIAERLRTDTSLIEQALAYIDRRMPTASANEQLELREWKGVLSTMSVPRIRRLLTEDTARGRRLRQSLPFLGALNRTERERLLQEESLFGLLKRRIAPKQPLTIEEMNPASMDE